MFTLVIMALVAVFHLIIAVCCGLITIITSLSMLFIAGHNTSTSNEDEELQESWENDIIDNKEGYYVMQWADGRFNPISKWSTEPAARMYMNKLRKENRGVHYIVKQIT